MTETKTLDILKQAILLEKRGQAFYQKVAEQTQNEAVQSFFKFMSEEEAIHIDILAGQFRSYMKNGQFEPDSFDENDTSDMESQVLNDEIKENISTTSYEAAAIGAAISMEKQALKIYKERAEDATDLEEKKVYEWLVSWEQSHLNMLLDIDKALIEKVWLDNHFWPF